MKTTSEPTCTNCMFSAVLNQMGRGVFSCRRYPQPYELPSTNHWCGEHQPKE